MSLITPEAARAELQRRQDAARKEYDRRRMLASLAAFIRGAWHVLEPSTPYVHNWHIDAICEHLEAVSRGEIKQLVINIPPGHMKSLITCVFWIAWVWLSKPSWRVLCASYAKDLALRDSGKTRDLILSDWYQETFQPTWKLKGDQNVKSFFANTASGYRMSLSVGGAGTGFRGDCTVVDDPLKVADAHNLKKRTKANDWYNTTYTSRVNDMRNAQRVVIMQRLHDEDLAGVLEKQGGYEFLVLPSEFEPENRRTTSIGWTDPRTESGQLLFEELFPPEVLAAAKVSLGSYGFAGQHQQRPAPADGGIFKRAWFGYWHFADNPLPPVFVRLPDGSLIECRSVALPKSFDEAIQSWDMAFTATNTSSFVVGQVWARSQANRFLIDQSRNRVTFTDTLHEVEALTAKWPATYLKLVENKANGPAVIDVLHEKISGLVAVNPEGDKVARASAVTPEFESGNVYFPHPKLYGWVDEAVERWIAFPNADMDEIDAGSQALRRFQQYGVLNLRPRAH